MSSPGHPSQIHSHNHNPSIAYLVHMVYGPFIGHHVKVLQVAQLMPCMHDVLFELRDANKQENAWRIFDHHLKNSHDPDKYEQLTSALHQCHYEILVCALNCGPVSFNQPAHSKMMSLLTHDLVETFVASEVAEQLASRGVLSLHHYEVIKRREHEEGKAEACFLLVDLLARQHESWYEHILDILNNCQYNELVTELEPTYYQKIHKLPTARLSHVGLIPSKDDSKARLCLPRQCNAAKHSPQVIPATKVSIAGSFGQREPQQASYYCDRENGRCSLKDSHTDASRTIPYTGHIGSQEALKTERGIDAIKCVNFDNPIATCSLQCSAKTDAKEMQTFEINNHSKDEVSLYRANDLNSASSITNQNELANHQHTDSKVEHNFTTQQERAPQEHASLHLCPATHPKSRVVSLSQSTCPCPKENPIGQLGLINHGDTGTSQPSYTNRERNSTHRQSFLQQHTFATNRPILADSIDHVYNFPGHLGSVSHDQHPASNQLLNVSHDNWLFPEPENPNAIGQTNNLNREQSPNTHQMHVHVNRKKNSTHGENEVAHETWRPSEDYVQNHVGPTHPNSNHQPFSIYQENHSANEPSFVKDQACIHQEYHSNNEPSFVKVKDQACKHQEYHSTNEPSFVKDQACIYHDPHSTNELSFLRDRLVSTSGQGSTHHEQGADNNPGCAFHKENSMNQQNPRSHIQSHGANGPKNGSDSKLREVTLSGVCIEKSCSLNHTQTSRGSKQDQNLAGNSCELSCNLRGYISLLMDHPAGCSTEDPSSYQRQK